MGWIAFSLIGPLFWAITSLIDKYLLEKYLPNPLVYLFLGGVAGLMILPGGLFFGMSVPTVPVTLAALFAGALFMYQLLLYFKALQITEASRVIPLYQFTPVFTLFFGFIFLHELLSVKALAAVLLLVSGGFLISLERTEGVFRVGRALLYMLGACLMCALYLTLSRYVYEHVPYFTGLAWETIGSFAGVAPLIFVRSVRRDISRAFRNMNFGAQALLLVNELINVGAIIFVQLALVGGPAVLVGAIGGIQPLYVLILTTMVSLFFPHILHEDTNWKSLSNKLLAIILIVSGVIILTV